MKDYLNSLVKKHETADFIKNDPVQFAHLYKNKNDIEIISFIASLLSFGRREQFIKKIYEIIDIMQNEPYNFVNNFDINSNCFNGFCYRFIKDADLNLFFSLLNNMYKKDKMSLQELFYNSHSTDNMLKGVCNYFYKNISHAPSQGFQFLISKPSSKGAYKRMNMYLRWMVRKGPVDLALWDFISPCDLIIPLDTHVSKISRSLGLLHRSANDFKSAYELTARLKEFDPNDPVKYDFALFAASVNKD